MKCLNFVFGTFGNEKEIYYKGVIRLKMKSLVNPTIELVDDNLMNPTTELAYDNLVNLATDPIDDNSVNLTNNRAC